MNHNAACVKTTSLEWHFVFFFVTFVVFTMLLGCVLVCNHLHWYKVVIKRLARCIRNIEQTLG